MDADSVRRWVEDRRAASAREVLEERAAGPRPAWAIAGALALIALTGRLHGWPVSESATDRPEDEIARERWTRLRERWRPGARAR